MKVIIVGCGKIGQTLIESLISEGHDVVAVDSDRAVTGTISNIYDAICVTGSATDFETLSEAGVNEAELFVSVTGSDETNMLSCFIAKKLGAKHTVARIRNPEIKGKNLEFIKHQLDISLIINPESLAAQEIFNILKLPSAVNIETFSRRNFEMIELIIHGDSPLDGMELKELRKKFSAKFLVCAVTRDGTTYIPGGDFVLRTGDKIGLTAEISEIHKLLREMGILRKQAKKVMILGASRMAVYLSRMLLKSGNDVKIVDYNKERCDEIANVLPDATVIHGDGTSREVLLEEGIESVDAFIGLTGMDEQNILISFFASSHNVPKVISKINRPELEQMAYKLGLETIVSPKKTVSDVVLRYARALHNSFGSNVETLYKLMDGKTEALEFKVSSDFKSIGIPLKSLNIKKNILIAGILRGRHPILPSGDDAIMAGDNVVIITAQRINDLSDILE